MKRGPHPDLIAAMRADGIVAPQERGLWSIQRQDFAEALSGHQGNGPKLLEWWKTYGAFDRYPDLPLVMTSLNRWTDATLHLGRGEAVMSDDPKELRKHLPVVLEARGRVLVTGLGLGCVVRGLLARPQVEHVDVVEVDAGVLEMVGPSFAGDPRVALHHADAITMAWPAGTRWDYAWHDVWGDSPGTQVLHAHLLDRYEPWTGRQGAWGFPRWMKRRWPVPLMGAASTTVRNTPA
jgi:hypothetical protein